MDWNSFWNQQLIQPRNDKNPNEVSSAFQILYGEELMVSMSEALNISND
jgi:hypothetical protein